MQRIKNTDFQILFTELRKRGISVLASSILFTEEHDKNTIWEDVDFVTSLNPDYLQFSPLGPIPGTKLYDDYEKQGKLIKNIPYESQHGQGKIWFHHDHFSRDESEDFLRLAFEIDYNRNGASMLRAIKTTLEGYLYCRNHPDERIRRRSKDYKKRLKMMRYFLTASTIFVQNRQSETLLREIKKSYRSQFGRMNLPHSGHIVDCRFLQYQRISAMSNRWRSQSAENILSPIDTGVTNIKSQPAKSFIHRRGCADRFPIPGSESPELQRVLSADTALANAIHLQDFNG